MSRFERERRLREVFTAPAPIDQIVDSGLSEVGMSAEAIARDRIASLPQGLPHYTHLIALSAARRANDTASDVVRVEDVTVGIHDAAANAQETITTMHHRAVMSARADSLYRQVALAAGMTRMLYAGCGRANSLS